MKIIKDTQKMENANEFGETLREYCFIPDKYGGTYGCYSTFELRPEFKHTTNECFIDWLIRTDHYWGKQLDSIRNDSHICTVINDLRKNLYSNGKIILTWHWDGDGELIIKEGNKVACNGDCKKDYVWVWLHE